MTHKKRIWKIIYDRKNDMTFLVDEKNHIKGVVEGKKVTITGDL